MTSKRCDHTPFCRWDQYILALSPTGPKLSPDQTCCDYETELVRVRAGTETWISCQDASLFHVGLLVIGGGARNKQELCSTGVTRHRGRPVIVCCPTRHVLTLLTN